MSTRAIKKINRRDFLKKSAKLSAVVTASGMIPLIGCTTPLTGVFTSDAEYDTIIKNGIIYDGTLSEPFKADIGIIGDRITAIGQLTGSTLKTIDASGHIVTPGFIDVHTHCDLTFKRTGLKRYAAYVMPSFKGNSNYMFQGVATVVTGNCGYGYTDTNHWLSIVDWVNFGTNVCHLIPHGMLRMELFGKNQTADLSTIQLESLKNRVEEEMEKGSFGFSTGLEYAPGLLCSTRELIEINKVVRKYNGIYSTHIRDLTGKTYADGSVGILKTLAEAVTTARDAEISTQISHLTLKVPFNNIRSDQILGIIDKARQEGLDIHADQFPYAAGATLLSARLPSEFKSDTGVLDTYKTKEGRKLIKKAIENRFEYSGPDKVFISMYPGKEKFEGQTLREIADATGKSPADLYVDFVCEDISPIAVFFDHNEQVLNDILERDYIMTASDSWTVPRDMTKPHPQAYGTFPKKLRKYALDEKRISLAQAVRSMTSLPAEKFNIPHRGKIKTGYYADIAVINPATITDHATYRNPHQYSEGIDHLLVNGTLSIENGKATGKRHGIPIRRI